MLETTLTIEWGDCDEAGIVFYPKYFYWFDCTYQRWLRCRGLSQRELRKRFGGVTPLVNVGARFVGPASYDQELRIRAEVAEWPERRFRVDYTCLVEGATVEERAWAIRTDKDALRGAALPHEFTQLMR